ncbi:MULTISPECIES: choice-of-anchor L domain-containing protein [Chryseobacterium]|uniref:Gliding motility-associated-like protein n=1 Tax=Chryseobacterium camelliae TaxID=1265445 RepID=A0ABU0TEV6_9FLAO|nr:MULTISPECIES: choice-of-anchor L domain-containing protein [Chryseobacterium]MDT3406707.1 gliding motility-associated-like protein [Pseudacidovorax intermedius]MDQ1095496.1 gliding motility-associated-like protein [Chryseobacterium camelliae]MDQ1099433.1 gliding motility-associated-like protein [Chryseobacterium sp. SORGH_AS_1048]MDR6086779.1 gliding motility-associated-like protein [Chryseobacterium sp. SORGH_AS_0909]MDR6131152.1 gliding motility-associated-like protein [Chryseobacterium s
MLNRRTGSLLLALFLVLIGHFAFGQVRQNRTIQPTASAMKAGAFIDVNTPNYPESSFNISQLVKDVLITGGSTCSTANVSNVNVSPNLTADNPTRSWGFFNKGTTNFPFDKGIVLITGQARKAGNTFQAGNLGDALSTAGDPDLAAALNVANTSLKDATYIEFDFVPTSTEVSFRYIFASEEYDSNFPCTISDGFALLLRPVSGGPYTNLAVLPNGAGPVSVTNIVPATYSCGPKNAQYFGGQNTANIETNFSGRTIPLTAKATVTPGVAYHFKMVLADYQDSNYDSGVFLEAGSFNIGVQLLDAAGVQLPSSINVCDNTPQTFTASTQVPNATYQWFLGTNPIPGATNPSYMATQPGQYTVQVFIPGNSCPGTASITIVGGTSPTVQNATLTSCYVQGNATFNLTTAQSSISTTPGATFTYYINQADANAGNGNTIANPTAFQSAGQTVYVLVKNGFCSKVAELTLVKAPQITATIAAPGVLTCTNQQVTLNASASVYPTGSVFNWTTAGGNIVSGGNTLNPVVNVAGTYTLTISNTYQPGNITCTGTASVTVTGDSAPPVTTVTASKTTICAGETVTLTASGGTTYTWAGLSGNGNTQTVTPTTTTTYTVTAVGANGCASQNPATVTIEVSQPITVQNAVLLQCYQPGPVNYDLTSAQPQITTATGVTFAYYINQADANAGNGNTITNPTVFSSAGNQTVYVLVKNGGCSYVVSLQLLKTAATTLTIAPPQSITCTNTQVTLNASSSVIPAGSTIAWTTTGGNIVSGANTLTPVVNAGGTYTLTVSNVSQPGNLNCTYTASVTVTENKTLPVAALTSSAVQICAGESVTLTASGGVSYNWTTLSGNGSTQVVSPSTTTVYSVYAVGANGCISANPATVTVIVGPPTATVSASPTKICAGTSVTLTASGGVTYNWVGLSGNGNTQVVTPTATTTYSVYALGGNGCSSINPATITIEVVPAITSTLQNVYVCAGDTGVLDAGSGPGYTYLWSTGATTQTISTNVPGTYTVTISNGTCSKTFSAQLLNPTLPQFTNVTYENHTMTLSATNPTGGVLEYSVDGGVTWQSSNVFYNLLNNTNYTIVVRAKDANCSTVLEYFTFVISNAITPNDDGKNDFVDFAGISKYNNFAASVFNRYGQEIFKATKTETIWTGTVRGISQPTGTYWYRVQWENPASKKLELRTGWILLKNRN